MVLPERHGMLVLLLFSLIPSALSDCPSGAYDLSAFGKCLILEKSGQDFGYFEAELTCQDMGGHLMSIQNGFENSILTAYAAGANIVGDIYIGADKHKKNDWTWTDGSSLNYTNWAAGNPKDEKQCAVLHVSDGKWYSEDCSQSIPYFCEVTDKEPECPPEWTLYNNSCYYKQSDSTHYLWPDARSSCRQLGGDLVSIHSQEEDNFVSDFANTSTCTMWWIGLQYTTDWSWSDGTPVTFALIDSGQQQPGYAIYPSCYQDGAGRWSGAQSNSYLKSFICKRSPESSLVNMPPEKLKKRTSGTKSTSDEGFKL